jgi:predicted esterase
MRKIAFFFVLLAAAFSAAAQETYLYAERDTCSLYMDVFRAAPGSQTSLDSLQKPTILYVFGGGFIGGKRTEPFIMNWFERLNSNGYTVVTIDYRLGMKGYKMGKGLRGAYQASDRFYESQQMGVEDLFAAISFINDNKEELGIDPANIVVAGSSAGAIIAQAAEYDIVSGRTEGLPEGFQFKGVMAFAGAVISVNGDPKYKSAPCPVLMLHGTADEAVAYTKYGAMGRGIWGSDYLAGHWAKKGFKGYCIYRFTGRTHDVAAYMNYLWDLEQPFLEKNVMQGIDRTVDATVDDPSLPGASWGQVSLDTMYRQ